MPRNPEARQSMQRIEKLWNDSNAQTAREQADRERMLAWFQELPIKTWQFLAQPIVSLLNRGESPHFPSRDNKLQ